METDAFNIAEAANHLRRLELDSNQLTIDQWMIDEPLIDGCVPAPLDLVS